MAKRRMFRATIVEVRLVPHVVRVIAETEAGAITKARRILRDTGVEFREKTSLATAEPEEEGPID